MDLTHSFYLLSFPAPFDTTEHLKPMVYKEPDCCGSDHWAKRRKIFKESKQWSSAGGSSITSDITEESGNFPSLFFQHGGRYQNSSHPCAPISSKIVVTRILQLKLKRTTELMPLPPRRMVCFFICLFVCLLSVSKIPQKVMKLSF